MWVLGMESSSFARVANELLSHLPSPQHSTYLRKVLIYNYYHLHAQVPVHMGVGQRANLEFSFHPPLNGFYGLNSSTCVSHSVGSNNI